MSVIAAEAGTSQAGTSQASQAEQSRPPVRTMLRQGLGHPLMSYYVVVAVGALLLGLGLLIVISASSVRAAAIYGDPYHDGKRQIMFAVIGLIGAWLFSRFGQRFLQGLAWPALGLAIVLLIATMTPLGVSVSGNNNWLSFGPSWTQFQPSEFAKLALILWGAAELSRRGKHLVNLKSWTMFLVASFSIVGLVVLQQDLGSALVIAGIVVIIMVAAGAPWRLLGAIFGVGVVGLVGLIVTQPYRMSRIWALFHPSADQQGINLQAQRGLYALASGGWFGQGLGASRQKWGLLAEAQTDYIFAILGEELGLVGTLTVIGLFAALAWVGIRIALRSTTSFTRLLAIGVVAWYSVQGFLNIAVACRVFPTMGVTLPLISYGGSSLLANLLALGLLVGCARREPAAAAALAARGRRSRGRPRAIVRADA